MCAVSILALHALTRKWCLVQPSHKRGDPRGRERVHTAFQAPAGSYPEDAELIQICNGAASDVQALFRRELTLCGRSTSLWRQLKGTEVAKKDLASLPLLPGMRQQPRVFSFQQSATQGQTQSHDSSGRQDDDDDLGDDEDLELDDRPARLGMLSEAGRMQVNMLGLKSSDVAVHAHDHLSWPL